MRRTSVPAAAAGLPEINRRILLGSALPVAAAVGVAMMAIPARASGGDDDLLAAGAAFTATMLAFETACRENYRTYDLWEDEVRARGLSICQNSAEHKAIAREVGYHAANVRMNFLCRKLVRQSRQIRAIVPNSLAGLAVWARAARFEAGDYAPTSDALHDADEGGRQIHYLTALIERMAGEVVWPCRAPR